MAGGGFEMRDWKKILAFEHTTAVRGTNYTCGLKYHLADYFQGKYLIENRKIPMSAAVRKARAFQFMLQNLPLTFSADQEFFGGAEIFKSNQLPAGVSEEEFSFTTSSAHLDYRRRNFTAGLDHTAVDFRTLVTEGLPGLMDRAAASHAQYGNPCTEAMRIIAEAVVEFFKRAAFSCRETHPDVSARLIRLTQEPPKTFADGLQLIWLTFVLVETDGRTHNGLARFDQYMYELYRNSSISREEALNLICHIWTKVEGLHETTNICIGGYTPQGEDAANELSVLCLEATKQVHSASTNLSARLHKKTSDKFLLDCIDLIASGIGFPAVFNDENNITMLTKLGIPIEDARDYALFGCVEPLIPGRQPAWSDGRFNMPESFLKAVMRLADFKSLDELLRVFEQEMLADMKRYVDQYNQELKNFSPEQYPDPLLSLFTRDCLARGLDINAGGAEFPRFHGIGMIGLATMTDGIAAIDKLLFREKKILPGQLVNALKNDFRDEEELRLMLLNCAPKYGNDQPETNSIAQWLVDLCAKTAQQYRTADGGFFLSCIASNVQNIGAGAKLGATPDGRHAGEPLSDAASPVGGRDRHGPTAFVNSIIAPDYTSQACTVVNMRFLPDFLKSEAGEHTMLTLLRRFVAGGGQEMQFNVTNNAVLKDAMKHPENYADLIVRVSGFSAFFNNLSKEIQQDIIKRTVHGQ